MRLILWACLLLLAACSAGEPLPAALPPEVPFATPPTKMYLTINDTRFAITLANNQATTALEALLPFTATMGDMNSNEKYHYLPRGLPTSVERPATIHAGDVMLFGSACLVVFYKTFSNSYNYTRIGRLDDPSGLEAALGGGRIAATFSR